MSERKRMPPASRVPQNTTGLAYFQIEEMHVGSWGPQENGEGPQTQVHVSLKLKGFDHPLVMRFKTADGLDNFINVLRRHRFDVWPLVPDGVTGLGFDDDAQR